MVSSQTRDMPSSYAGDLGPPPIALTAPLALVERRLQQVLDTVADDWRVLSVDSLGGLALLRDTILRGGKRIRPLLCHWGYVAAHGDLGDAAALADIVTAGAALELLHTFALIHDDVMDESDTRRAGPTIHRSVQAEYAHRHGQTDARRHGESVAILLGDLVHACADDLASSLPPDARRLWRDLSVHLMLGQYLDLEGAATRSHDLRQAGLVARLKSGDYSVERPLLLGASLAGTTQEYAACMRSYGRPLGQAFQLRDDLIGVWGDPAATGKPVGDDLRAGKPTVLVALAHERADAIPGARDLLNRLGAPDLDDTEITELQQLLEDTGVRADCERRVKVHVNEALSALAAAPLHPDGAEALEQLAHMLAWRQR